MIEDQIKNMHNSLTALKARKLKKDKGTGKTSKASGSKASPSASTSVGGAKNNNNNNNGASNGKAAAKPKAPKKASSKSKKAKDAAEKAGWSTPRTIGSAVASDAFFPFADGLLAAVEAGATAVIQPGGSIRDADVIAAADEAGLAMVFTGMRHFRH